MVCAVSRFLLSPDHAGKEGVAEGLQRDLKGSSACLYPGPRSAWVATYRCGSSASATGQQCVST